MKLEKAPRPHRVAAVFQNTQLSFDIAPRATRHN
jgi:hypothetical protein